MLNYQKGKTFLWNPTQKSCMIDFFVSGITTDIYTLTVEDDFKTGLWKRRFLANSEVLNGAPGHFNYAAFWPGLYAI